MDYQEFLQSKRIAAQVSGFEVAPDELNPLLFPFQREIVSWALRVGRTAIFADCGLGKGQPIGSKVLTPHGWKRIETLVVGDLVIASDGKSHAVKGVYPKGDLPTYRVHFSDKTSFVVDEDHLHICRTNNDRQRGKDWRVLSTKELLVAPLRYGKDGKSRNFDIPVVAPICFESDKAALPVHPYVLGAVIGDGCLTVKNRVEISNPDAGIIEKLSSCLECDGMHLQKHGDIGYYIAGDNPTKNSAKNANLVLHGLRDLGLMGKKANEKFIPRPYLFATVSQRTELLRGLMDTDGYICESSQYYTVSPQLCDDVVFLVRSLGGVPTVSLKENPQYSHKGEIRHGQNCYIITFSLKGINPFSLERKAAKWNPSPRDNGRWIDRIEFECVQPAICISVDSPDHSYVTENFIVTHNTAMQLEWAHRVCLHTSLDVLILTPLAVAQQTKREAEKFGIEATVCRTQADVRPGINITNYEMMQHFDAAHFAGVVLDESSILKSFTGKMRNEIIDLFARTRYKLCCTATPAPNDHMELGNHSEFLGNMTRTEMLAMFFTHDGGETSKWRLKGHAQEDFWAWVCTWGVALTKPSDLGYDDGAFHLPPLKIHHDLVEAGAIEGKLFAAGTQTLTERREARKGSLSGRVERAAEIAQSFDEPVLIWCDFNAEGDELEKLIPGAVQIAGADSADFKADAMMKFASGEIKVLISKPAICGFGMNFQVCSKVIFCGLSDSYEKFYQAVRRCWRFGQTRPVECFIITSDAEAETVKNIERKEADAQKMASEMVAHTHTINTRDIHRMAPKGGTYLRATHHGNDFAAHLGDCVEIVSEMESDSIGYSIFSPPFSDLYTYSNSERDMGNAKNDDEFFAQFEFLTHELLRVMMPGRLLSFHCMNLPTSKQRDGVIGIRDFRGDLIRLFQKAGFIYHSEVCIWKDPVTAMQRTKALGLLHKTIRKDSAMSRQGIADYLVTMRKPGANPEPISHTHDDFPVSLWQRYASPVWFDINPSKTLQRTSAREEKDERHICPLQLDVIERGIELWSKPGDLILSPFMGIGSEGYMALKMGRRFVGCELKESYWNQARLNLEAAETERAQLSLFEELEPVAA